MGNSVLPDAGVDSGTITNLSNLGEDLRRSGQSALAVRVLRAAQRLAGGRLAPSNRVLLLVGHNLAAALAAEGSFDLAKTQLDDLVLAMDQHLGADDALTLRARRQQAILMARLGQGELALERQLSLAEKHRDRSGATSRELSQAVGDIAGTLQQLGRSGEADQYREMQRATGVVVDASQGVYV